MDGNTVRDASTLNDSATRPPDTGNRRGICSAPVRYRFIGPDEKPWAWFRLHSGVTLPDLMPAGEGWEVEGSEVRRG